MSTQRSEAMLKVILWHLAGIESRKGFFWFLKSQKKIYNQYLKESVNTLEHQVNEMQKFV